MAAPDTRVLWVLERLGEGLILRGPKTIEYRSRPTTIIGERFYIYAARKAGDPKGFAALDAKPGDLPTGLLVGTATITRSVQNDGRYEWHLSNAKRLDRPRMPQPVWFKPF